MCRSVDVLLRRCSCGGTVRGDAPLGIEGIDTDKLVLLRCLVCVLLEQVGDVVIVVDIRGHDGVVKCSERERTEGPRLNEIERALSPGW